MGMDFGLDVGFNVGDEEELGVGFDEEVGKEEEDEGTSEVQIASLASTMLITSRSLPFTARTCANTSFASAQ